MTIQSNIANLAALYNTLAKIPCMSYSPNVALHTAVKTLDEQTQFVLQWGVQSRDDIIPVLDYNIEILKHGDRWTCKFTVPYAANNMLKVPFLHKLCNKIKSLYYKEVEGKETPSKYQSLEPNSSRFKDLL
jgi:hypothetical protein